MDEHAPAADLEGPTEQPDAEQIGRWLSSQIGSLLEMDPAALDPHTPLEEYGLASSDVVFLTGDLSSYLGRFVSATVAWDHPTIAELSDYLAAALRGEVELPDEELAWDLDTDLYDVSDLFGA